MDIYVINCKTRLTRSEQTQMLLDLASQYTTKKLVIARTKDKKPYFKNHKTLYFNVSHSGTKLVFCFSKKPVGVDIEKIEKRKNLDKIAKRICTDQEFLLFKKTASKNKLEAFYKLWTKKEAISKCLGTGFKGGFKNMDTLTTPVYTKKIKGYVLSVC